MTRPARHFLLHAKQRTGYLIASEADEEYLVRNEYAYCHRASGFLRITPKGLRYAERERRYLKNGRAAH